MEEITKEEIMEALATIKEVDSYIFDRIVDIIFDIEDIALTEIPSDCESCVYDFLDNATDFIVDVKESFLSFEDCECEEDIGFESSEDEIEENK